jgi:hypothetical protein
MSSPDQIRDDTTNIGDPLPLQMRAVVGNRLTSKPSSASPSTEQQWKPRAIAMTQTMIM